MLLKIGYFYLYSGYILGESHGIETKPNYEGHSTFWESESINFFPASPEIRDIQLCWYGCNRGRITFIDRKYQILGTPEVFRNCKAILKLFGYSDNASVVRIYDDDHYRIVSEDAELLRRNHRYFKVPENYRFLIGKVNL